MRSGRHKVAAVAIPALSAVKAAGQIDIAMVGPLVSPAISYDPVVAVLRMRAEADDAKRVVDAALRELAAHLPRNEGLSARTRHAFEDMGADADLHRPIVIDEGGELLLSRLLRHARPVGEDRSREQLGPVEMARRRVLVWPVAQVEWIVGRRLEADMEEFVRLAAARRLAREQLLLRKLGEREGQRLCI